MKGNLRMIMVYQVNSALRDGWTMGRRFLKIKDHLKGIVWLRKLNKFEA